MSVICVRKPFSSDNHIEIVGPREGDTLAVRQKPRIHLGIGSVRHLDGFIRSVVVEEDIAGAVVDGEALVFGRVALQRRRGLNFVFRKLVETGAVAIGGIGIHRIVFFLRGALPLEEIRRLSPDHRTCVGSKPTRPGPRMMLSTVRENFSAVRA